MRPAGILLQLAVCLSSLSLAAAWPDWLPELDTLVVRQDSSDSKSSASATDSSDSASETSANLNTANLNTAQVDKTGTATDSDSTETGTATGKNNKATTTKKSSKSTHTTFGANDAVGGVSLQTPQTTLQATPLYKIGDDITFGWNYTSLQGTPTAIDVLVSCSSASATWTLTQNMTFQTKVSYVWDTNSDGGVETQPLRVDLFTLIIKDSDASISDTADPGYLGSYTGLKFGLYTGQPYTPLSEWKCVGCNDGTSIFDKQALGLAMTMSFITVATFTWFVAGLGLQ